jgi:FKBP-type peptidyl-prolyl cis-trans isomerase SlyD
MAERIARHKAVFFTYEIHDQAGALFERSDIPIGYVHGAEGPLLAVLERHLEGHAAGDALTVQVSPAEGFGERRPNLTFTDDIDNVPPQFRRVGAEVDFQNDRGEVAHAVVSHIGEGKLTVDANHPLAGQRVTYRIRIVEVRDATPQEIARGQPDSPFGSALH